jgi:hypothetical protein
MINFLIAFDIDLLEKKWVLAKAKDLYRSNLLNEEQWQKISEEFASGIYTPSLFMRVLLFIFSLAGMFTIIGPIGAILGDIGRSGFQILALLLGIFLILFTERVLIKNKFHFNSGITEAGLYSGLLFIAFGLLGSNPDRALVYPIVGFVLTAFAAVRFLNLTALVLMVGCVCWILFQIILNLGGFVEALMPFIFMAFFGLLYGFSLKLQKRISNVIFENQFVILKTSSLTLFYLAGNYFVVRELSIKLMGLNLAGQDDIPFAFIFYTLTALIPIGYICWGIMQKSILQIRVALLTIFLSTITFKYYFSLGPPEITITLSGLILIAISLLCFNYLKQIRRGYTRELLINGKWNSPEFAAIIASQTLGGNKISDAASGDPLFNGGRFGGGGAGGNW